MAAELAALEARLGRLERQNRWLKRSVGLAVAAAGLALVLGGPRPGQAQPGGEKSIEAERFVLRDAHGKKRAVLGIAGGTSRDSTPPTLALYDENEKPRLMISASAEDGAEIALGSELKPTSGFRPRLILSVSAAGRGGVVWRDEEGKIRLRLWLDEDDRPHLVIQDSKEVPVFAKP